MEVHHNKSSFTCQHPSCHKQFPTLDRLVKHASKDHAFASVQQPGTTAAAASRRSTSSSLVKAFSNFVANLANARLAVALLVVCSAVGLGVTQSLTWHLMEYSDRQAGRTHDADALRRVDWRMLGYSQADVQQYFTLLDTPGRSLFLRLQTWESTLLAPSIAFVLSLIFTVVARSLEQPSLQPLNLVPFVFPLVKSAEATILFSLLSDFSRLAEHNFIHSPAVSKKVAFASSLTLLKIRIILPSVIGLTVSLASAIPVRWLLKFGEKKYDQQAEEWEEVFGDEGSEEQEGEYGDDHEEEDDGEDEDGEREDRVREMLDNRNSDDDVDDDEREQKPATAKKNE